MMAVFLKFTWLIFWILASKSRCSSKAGFGVGTRSVQECPLVDHNLHSKLYVVAPYNTTTLMRSLRSSQKSFNNGSCLHCTPGSLQCTKNEHDSNTDYKHSLRLSHPLRANPPPHLPYTRTLVSAGHSCTFRKTKLCVLLFLVFTPNKLFKINHKM